MIKEYIYIKNFLKKGLRALILKKNQIICVIDESYILEILKILKGSSFSAYKQLMDIFIVDYPNRRKRFELNYVLLSVKHSKRMIIKIFVTDKTRVLSVTKIYSSALWLERECWDMFGVCFKGNKDLRRILTDYGFLGHPLRKDFPLTGFVEVRYDDNLKAIVTEPLELSQDLRLFDFVSPWIEIGL